MPTPNKIKTVTRPSQQPGPPKRGNAKVAASPLAVVRHQ